MIMFDQVKAFLDITNQTKLDVDDTPYSRKNDQTFPISWTWTSFLKCAKTSFQMSHSFISLALQNQTACHIINHSRKGISIFLQNILFSRVLHDSTHRYVGWSVGRLVGWSVGHTLLFLFVLFLLAYFKSNRSFKVKLDHFKSF